MAYGYYGTHAPGDLSHAATYPYIATQNCLLAHAEAWHVYDKEFRKTQKGKKLGKFHTWFLRLSLKSGTILTF